MIDGNAMMEVRNKKAAHGMANRIAKTAMVVETMLW
jgi:hypothetical protein